VTAAAVSQLIRLVEAAGLQFPVPAAHLNPSSCQQRLVGGAPVEKSRGVSAMMPPRCGSIWSAPQAVRTGAGKGRWFLERGYVESSGGLDEA